LTDRFEQAWLAATPDGIVLRRDLTAEPLPFLTEAWINASYTPEAQRTDEQRALLAKSDELIEELFVADEIVIGSPMWNFGAPASMKAYIDLIARAGKTFRYTATGPEGLLKGKRVMVITARGGTYAKNTPTANWDYQEPYLRQVFQFLGISDVTFVNAEFQGRGGELAAKGEALAEAEIEAYFQNASQVPAFAQGAMPPTAPSGLRERVG
jgi:FMN-dependent NADH-azoreductase